MIVQDLLKQCDFDTQTKLVCSRKPDYEPPYDPIKIKSAYEKFVNMLLSLKAVPSNDFILFEKYWWDDDDKILETVEAELYEYENFKNAGKDILESGFIYKDIPDDLTTSEIKEMLSEYPELPFTYAYEFTEWEKVLGYQVFEENFHNFDIQECIYAILYEMSFNGMDRDSQIERKEELNKSIEEVEKIMKLPEEEQSKHLHSFDDVINKSGFTDTRTKEEKDEDMRRLYYCSLKTRYEKYKDILLLYNVIVHEDFPAEK